MYTVKQERGEFISGKETDLTKMSLHDLKWWEIHLAALLSTAKEMERDMDYWEKNGLEKEVTSQVLQGGSDSMRRQINQRIIEIADQMREVWGEIKTRPVSGVPTLPPYRMHFVMERKTR